MRSGSAPPPEKAGSRSLQTDLTTFGGAARQPGLAEELAELYTKLTGANIGPEELRRASENLSAGRDSLLKEKLSDLALLFSHVRMDLEARFLTPDDTLLRAASALPVSPYKGLPVFIDGYGGVSYAVLEMTRALMRCASELTIALTLDPTSERNSFFAPDSDILDAIRAYAPERGIAVTEISFDGTPPNRSAPLGYLEKTIFRFSQKPYAGRADGIVLGAEPSRQREADAACERILQTIRTTENCRYRDFAVLVPDMEKYRVPLRRALDAREIPSFLDDRPPLLAHSLSRFLLSAVRCAAFDDPVPDLLSFVKSGYLPVGTRDTDLFENYVRRFTPTPYHARIRDPFTKECPEREPAERVRACVQDLLLPFRKGFALPSVREKTAAVYDLMERSGVRAALETEAQTALDGKMLIEMHVASQAWNGVVTILDQLVTVLGDTPADRETYCALLQEGLSEMSVGVIPELEDGVLVGDIHKTRLRPVKHMFLLGVSEGALPASVSDDALLDDREIERLREAGLSDLHGTARDAALEERRIYLAVTKAIQTLTVTYPMNADGDETLPSTLYASLQELFPNRGSDEALLPQSREEALYRFGDDLHAASAGMDPSDLYPVLDSILGDDAAAVSMRKAGKNDPILPSLRPDAASRLFAGLRKMSASRLESFSRCPFSYFLKYGIDVKERKEAERKATDLGSLYHEALERFLRVFLDGGADPSELTDEGCDALLDGILRDLFPTFQDGYYMDQERCLGEDVTVRNVLSLAFRAIRDQLGAGSFRPAGVELAFGDGQDLPAIPLRTKSGRTLLLEGKVDRIDRAEDPGTGNVYLRVIDYKTGGKAFSFLKLREGLLLQLPLYLSAVRDRGIAAGLYYMPIQVSPVPESGSAEKALSDEFRLIGVSLDDEAGLAMNGPDCGRVLKGVSGRRSLVTAGQMDAVLDAANAIASMTADRILRGEIRAFPADDACKYCPYRACCGFDPALKACRKKKVTGTLRIEDFLDQITGGNAHGLDG